MKVNFSSKITDENGKEIPLDGNTTMDLGYICCTVLLMSYKDDHPSGDEKHRRFKLWQRLSASGELDVTAEEITLLKRLLGLGATTIVCGQAWDLLEGAQ